MSLDRFARIKIFLVCFLFLFFGIIGSKVVHAVTAAPGTHTLTQPGGTTFQAHQWGDEWNHGWETLDSYTIVKKDSEFWVYAYRGFNGALQPTDQPAHMAPPPTISKNLRPVQEPAERIEIRRESAQNVIKARVVPSTGSAQAPVILINFNNTSTTNTTGEFEDLLFGNDPAVATGPGSMKDYYEEVSYGNFTVSGTVTGWYEADKNHDYYGKNDADGSDEHPAELVKEAVQAADSDIDFSNYDNDGDGTVENVIIVHQGSGEEASGDSTDIWSHSWSLSSAGIGSLEMDGVTVDDYVIQPERQYGHMVTMGVFAHEFGHALGLPDLYDTDGSSAGIGNWGLMGGGSWNGVSYAGDCPAHTVAWSKWYLGWALPTQITTKLKDEPISSANVSADFYYGAENPYGVDWVFKSSSGNGEYFLFENRQLSGFDQGLPGPGILVTQIAEYVTSSNAANQNEDGARLVDVKEADGNNELDKNENRGDAADLFTKGDSFDKSTDPAAVFYDGTNSTCAMTSVSASGDPMNATLNCGCWIKEVTVMDSTSGEGLGELYRTLSYVLDVLAVNTNFVDGSTTAYFTGDGLSVTNVSVINATTATVSIDVSASAELGYRNMTMETGNENASMKDAVEVVAATPQAMFSVSPSSPKVGENVDFVDESSDIDGSVTNWEWDFDGDGTVDSTSQNASHTYSNSGSYNAELAVTDNEGDTDNVTKTIEVSSCSFSISPTSASFDADGGNQDVYIDASSSDCSWSVSNSLDWVSASTSSGTGDSSVTVSVEENTESSSRSDTVTIANNDFNIDQQASDDSNGGGGGGGCTMNPNASFSLSWILLLIIPVFMIVRRRL